MSLTRPRLVAGVGLVVGSRYAARLLGVSERTILRWVDDGTLTVVQRTPAGHRRYRLTEVTQLVATRNTNP